MDRDLSVDSLEDFEILAKVYFDSGEYELDEQQRLLLVNSLQEKSNEINDIVIIGYADRVGSAMYNSHLSQLRAARVMSEVKKASPNLANIISIDGLGEIAVPVSTDDGIGESKNRTVHIYFRR